MKVIWCESSRNDAEDTLFLGVGEINDEAVLLQALVVAKEYASLLVLLGVLGTLVAQLTKT